MYLSSWWRNQTTQGEKCTGLYVISFSLYLPDYLQKCLIQGPKRSVHSKDIGNVWHKGGELQVFVELTVNLL